MATTEETLQRLAAIPDLSILKGAALAKYTRFGIGGPADAVVETEDANAFLAALETVRASGVPFVVIGGGSNLIVSDAGFRGIVLKLKAHAIRMEQRHAIAEGGAVLQDLVDATVAAGLSGIHTMTGIPGSVGAAVYGNAGAYGHSISEWTRCVRFSMAPQFGNSAMRNASFIIAKAFLRSRKIGLCFQWIWNWSRAMRLR